MPRNTVALGIRGPAVEAGGGTNINPLQMGLDLMRMQQLGLESRGLQLKQWGMQGAGEIMARHPLDEEGGLRELLSSPYAPYVGDFVAQVRASNASLAQTHKTLAETGELNYKLGDTAIHGAVKFLAPYYNAVLTGAPESELENLKTNAQRQMALTTSGMTKDQQQIALQGMQAMFDGLDGNFPKDATPEQIRQIRLNRLGPMLVTSGLDAQAQQNIIGHQFTIDTPTAVYGGYTSPWSGPQFNTVIPKPGYQEPGRSLETPPIPAPLSPSTGQPQVGNSPWITPPNALSPAQPQPQPSQAQPSQAQPQPAQPQPAQPAQSQAAVPTAGDGTPLYKSGIGAGSTPGSIGTGNRFIYQNAADEDADKEMLKVRNDAGMRAYEGAQNAQFQLTNMDRSLDALAGTPLQTGAAGEQRLQLARAWNTAFDTLGSFGLLDEKTLNNFKFKGSTLQEAESFLKSQTLAQFATVVNNFGAQREAAQTIQRALMAVPGMDNTYMGNKLVLEGLRSVAQRVQDHWMFQEEWMRNNHGSLKGMEAAFNQAHPSQGYAQAVLDKFGLGPQGFTSGDAIDNAFQHGWIDKQQAINARGRLQ